MRTLKAFTFIFSSSKIKAQEFPVKQLKFFTRYQSFHMTILQLRATTALKDPVSNLYLFDGWKKNSCVPIILRWLGSGTFKREKKQRKQS